MGLTERQEEWEEDQVERTEESERGRHKEMYCHNNNNRSGNEVVFHRNKVVFRGNKVFILPCYVWGSILFQLFALNKNRKQ